MAFKKLFIILNLIFWSFQVFASAPLCSSLFVSHTEYLNQQMAQRYPSIKFVVENPDQFVINMRERFETQKIKSPNDPYTFDYSELGLPLVKDVQIDLMNWMAELNQNYKDLKDKKSPFDLFKIHETKTLLDYSQALIQEAGIYTQDNKINYKQSIEFAYFYTRIRGKLDTRKQSPLLRFYLFFDRTILNGHHPKSAKQEFQMYKDRKFSVFIGKGFSPGFREAAIPFERALFNPEKLETIWIPSNAALGPSIFMRLLSRNINFIGVTSTPILADGILRPSSDFWIHDIRHESVKYFLFKEYQFKKDLTEAQTQKLALLIDKWLVEQNIAVSLIDDKELRAAVKLLIFSYHHDRGFPLIPSVYLTPNNQKLYTNILYTMQRTAGEKVAFTQPIENLNAADKWLKEFWLNHIEEEKAFLDDLN
ncbi:hypothetical protein CIK05_14740 [Bdellovibrio sp. qaytius]|nr:hypothetical protein CIK05_14740 [Bdellovibrio sp. qaytius]